MNKHKLGLYCIFLITNVLYAETDSRVKDTDITTQAADIVAERFIANLTDASALYDECKMTAEEFKKHVRDALVGDLKNSPLKDYFADYKTRDDLRHGLDGTIFQFYTDYVSHRPELDTLSLFLFGNLHFKPYYMEGEEPSEYGLPISEKLLRTVFNLQFNVLVARLENPEASEPVRIAEKYFSPEFWVNLSWLLSYPIGDRIEDVNIAWWCTNTSLQLLSDRALRFHPESWELYRELSFTYYHRFGNSNCKFRNEFNLIFAVLFPKYYADLDEEYLKSFLKKYPSLDWESPLSFALYWAERGLAFGCGHGIQKNENMCLSSINREIFHALSEGCNKGEVVLVKDHDSPIFVVSSPNFTLYETYCDFILVPKSFGEKEEFQNYNIKQAMESILDVCYKYDKVDIGEKLYARLRESLLNDSDYTEPFEDFMKKRIDTYLSIHEPDKIKSELGDVAYQGVLLIAVGKKVEGIHLLNYGKNYLERAKYLKRISEGDWDSILSQIVSRINGILPPEYKRNVEVFIESKQNTQTY